MNRRALLRAWVKLGVLTGVAGFAGVFVYGLFVPRRHSTGDVIDIGGLPAGSARLEGWQGTPLWVVHRSERQLEALVELSEHVHDTGSHDPARVDNRYRSVRRAYGIYLAATDRTGVFVQYVRERPRRLRAGTPWHGGFVDPGSGAVFDPAGRRYRSSRGGPLPVPPHRYPAGGVIRLGEW